MKKILFAALICIIALSCEEKSKYAIEREQKEAELKQIRDLPSNTPQSVLLEAAMD